jgi:hypothetical protein
VDVALALLISLLMLGGSGEPRVAWAGADVCPGAEHVLERALDDYVGPAALADAVAAKVRLVDAGGSGVQLTLTLESEAGREQHELRGLGCEQIIDEAALLLAGVIDPFAYSGGDARMQHEVVPIQRPLIIERAPPREAAPAIQPATEPEIEVESPAPRPVPTPDRAPRDSVPSRGSLGVAATSFVGLFPQIGGGAQVEGGLDRGAFRWQGAITGYFGGQFRASEADVGANLWALDGSTKFCGVPRAKRIQLPLCGVAGVGFVSARAVGTLEPQRSVRPWVHVGGEVGVSVLARPNLAIGLGVGVHVAVVRPSWEVRAPDVHFAIPPVMGLARLRVEISPKLRSRKISSPGDQNARL